MKYILEYEINFILLTKWWSTAFYDLINGTVIQCECLTCSVTLNELNPIINKKKNVMM